MRGALSDWSIMDILFREGPQTPQEMADKTGLQRKCIYRSLHRLESRGMVAIDGWAKERIGNHWPMKWGVGPVPKAWRER